MRTAPRVAFQESITLYFDGRRSIVGRTIDMSLTGGLVRLDEVQPDLEAADEVTLNFDFLSGASDVSARVVGVAKRDVRLQFDRSSLQSQQTIVRAVFGRADAWVDWAERPTDTVGSSLGEIVAAIRSLFSLVFRRRRRMPSPRPTALDGPSPQPIQAS